MTSGPDAYGRHHDLTWVDRLGVWLSARRIRREAGGLRGKAVGDFGCGFDATFVRSVLPELEHVVLVDVALAPDLVADGRVTGIEGSLPDALQAIDAESLDVVMCVSVLEHLTDPLDALVEFRRVTRPGGVVLLNVPSWWGKRMLELSAFRLHLSPPDSVDDHKWYFDPRDLWPLLVRAGFRPRDIRCFRHKFGLNTFAVCRVPAADGAP
jgi:SAM-dependent methyltransferase